MPCLVVLFLLLVCGSAAAQTISDTELRAGYCLGVSTLQVELERASMKENAWHEPILRLAQQSLEQIQERQKRFQDYLTAKGTKDRSPEALRIASERGKKDVATCEAELEQEFYKECAERCDRANEKDENA